MTHLSGCQRRFFYLQNFLTSWKGVHCVRLWAIILRCDSDTLYKGFYDDVVAVVVKKHFHGVSVSVSDCDNM